jgi:hypothetical protein
MKGLNDNVDTTSNKDHAKINMLGASNVSRIKSTSHLAGIAILQN